jgi:hypothetical protein
MVNGALRQACRLFSRPWQVVRMLRCAVSVGQTVGQRGEKGLSSAGNVHVACIMMQPATCNMQHEACNMQHNTQRATQHEACSMRCTPLHGALHVAQSVACYTVCCTFLHLVCFCTLHVLLHVAYTDVAVACCTYNVQHRAVRREGTLPATCKVQRAKCNVQHATCYTQHAARNVQHATCSTQRATCTQHSAGRDGRAHCGCALASPHRAVVGSTACRAYQTGALKRVCLLACGAFVCSRSGNGAADGARPRPNHRCGCGRPGRTRPAVVRCAASHGRTARWRTLHC